MWCLYCNICNLIYKENKTIKIFTVFINICLAHFNFWWSNPYKFFQSRYLYFQLLSFIDITEAMLAVPLPVMSIVWKHILKGDGFSGAVRRKWQIKEKRHFHILITYLFYNSTNYYPSYLFIIRILYINNYVFNCILNLFQIPMNIMK